MAEYSGRDPCVSIGDTSKIVLETGIDLTGSTKQEIHLYTLAAFMAGGTKLATLLAGIQTPATAGKIEANLEHDTFPAAGEYVARASIEWASGAEVALGAPVQFVVTRGI